MNYFVFSVVRLGEYSKTVIINGDPQLILVRSKNYWLDNKYELVEESLSRKTTYFLAFTKEKPSRNLYGFSLDRAHRQLFIKMVSDKSANVCSIEVFLNFPWLFLSNNDLKSIESKVETFLTWITISVWRNPSPTIEESEELSRVPSSQ